MQCNAIENNNEKILKYFSWYHIYVLNIVLILKYKLLTTKPSPRNLSFDLRSVHVESVVEKC